MLFKILKTLSFVFAHLLIKFILVINDFAQFFVITIGPPLLTNRLLSTFRTIHSAVAVTMAVFTTAPFSHNRFKKTLTCSSISSRNSNGLPCFFPEAL